MRFARRASPNAPTTPREQRVCLLLAIMVAALGSVFFPAAPASAADRCGLSEWQKQWKQCAEKLPPANSACLDPPVPSAPDSGLAGWFATEPTKAWDKPHNPGVYIDYGYGGYDFHTYALRCGAAGADPGIATENMIANWELKLASGVVGASNAVREKAWDPGSLWSWADRLLERASETIYTKVFTTFGAITLCVVGIYLIWRSRQADMSDSMTTAGWAVLVMLVVTAVAVYPVWAANLADGVLTQSLDVVHDAAGPRPERLTRQHCSAGSCEDPRPPAERASEIATDSVLYRNWLRGVLGSADSEAAAMYGTTLYDAQAFSWKEQARIDNAAPKNRQAVRDSIIKAKQDRFNRVAEQIKREDPEAYEHLQGKHGADRIGAGFIALLSAVFFGFFDLVASVLILLSFMIFRWAVIAAPLLGTVALLRPASGGLKRMGNAVVAGIFNIVIFGAGAAIYLLAVQVIVNTRMAGWLQLLLVGLCGLAGWILLRPYQRFAQLGGSGGDRSTLGDRILARSRPDEATSDKPAAPAGSDHAFRPETRADNPVLAPFRSETTGEAVSKQTGDRPANAEMSTTGGVPARGRPDAQPDGPAASPPMSRSSSHESSYRDEPRGEPAGYHLYVPDSRRAASDHLVDHSSDTSSPPPLYVPESWRDTPADRP